ncbi:MAG TPA: hypothetical protein VFB21_00235 [Chthonomonadaceae bacterium]|nr:hypothetical protein [Chthonomonadaceae bacterium]
MGERMLLYNVLAYSRYKLPVQSVIILLRKEADGPAMSGKIGYEAPQSQAGSLALRYRVVRVWEKAVEEVLYQLRWKRHYLEILGHQWKSVRPRTSSVIVESVSHRAT